MKRRYVLVALLGVGVQAEVSAQLSRAWNPEDRVVLRDHSDVRAMALTNAGLFVATRGGLGVYDTRTRRWFPPVTQLDGLPPGDILTAIGDPADETLWIGMTTGLVHYLPVLREIHHVQTSGAVVQLALDESDPFRGIYFATSTGWWFLPRGSSLPTSSINMPPPERRVHPLTVQEVLQREPAADASRSLILLDSQLRQFAYTAVAEDERRREFYFGTNGAGVFRYDPGTVEFTPMPFGLLADRVGAVLWHDGQVLTGSGGRDGRVGFSTVESGFQQVVWDDGSQFGGYDFTDVRALMDWHDATWAATDGGLIRVDQPAERVTQALPSTNAFALARGESGLWIGTARGIAVLRHFDHAGFVIDETQVTTAPVLSLATEGHDIWIGTTAGLRILRGTAEGIEVPAGTQEIAALSEPVVGLVRVKDRLVAATTQEVVWRDSSLVWHRLPPVPAIGLVTTLAEDADGVWIGGEDGLAHFAFANGGLQTVAGPGTLPGRVRSVTVGGGFVWVATEGGLVRLRRGMLLR